MRSGRNGLHEAEIVTDNLPHIGLGRENEGLVESFRLAVLELHFSKCSHHNGRLVFKCRLCKQQQKNRDDITSKNNQKWRTCGNSLMHTRKAQLVMSAPIQMRHNPAPPPPPPPLLVLLLGSPVTEHVSRLPYKT